MNKINHTLKKMLLLITTGMLSGCFESPSESSSIPEKKPLKQTSSEIFTLPDGVTDIQSAFSEAKTTDWGDAQNWTSSFYKDGESVGYDLSHKFVPCRAQKPDLPNLISIDNGTCFVNESVDISGLKMSWHTRLTIPEGVSVKSIANFDIKNVTIDGGGDFFASGKPQSSCTGNIKLNTFHAPEVSWVGLDAKFEVNKATLHYLGSDKIYVKDRLDVSDISFADTMDVSIHRLHITKSDRDSARLAFCNITRPINIDHLSFDPGTRIETRKNGESYVFNSTTWHPIRLTGTLDVTHMNPVLMASSSHQGTIGEKIPVIIAEKGIVGDPNIMRRHRRCVVSGYFTDFNKEYMGLYTYQGTYNLMWLDDTQVYWQRTVTPGIGSKNFLLINDFNFMNLARDNPNKSYESLLDINETELNQMQQLCEALWVQRKRIHDNATESGIERYLEVQLTPNATDRVHKLLALADIQPYLNEQNVLSESGEQAVIDSLAHFSNTVTSGIFGLQTVNRSFVTPLSSHVGFLFNSSNYSLSGVFHQRNETSMAPWVLGIEYRTKLQTGVCGVLRTLGEGATDHPFALHVKGGIGYTLSPTAQLTFFVSSKGIFCKELTEGNRSLALPTSTVYSLDTGIEWSTRMGAHELRVGGDVTYRPQQTVSVHIADLGVTIDNLAIASRWNIKGCFGYAYNLENGIQCLSNIALATGEGNRISGMIGVRIER